MTDAISDVQAVTELVHRLARALDDRDWATCRSLIAPDARAQLQPGVGLEGYDAIEQALRPSLDGLTASHHMISNVVVTIEGETATSACYLQARHVKPGPTGADAFTIWGRYDDSLVRRGAAWVLTRRTLTVVLTEGSSAVLRPTTAPTSR